MSILVGHCRVCGFEAELFTLTGLDFVLDTNSTLETGENVETARVRRDLQQN